MASSSDLLYQLYNSLSKNTYTGRTEEEKKKIAQNRYSSVYGEKRLAAQQAYETQDNALQRELSDLEASYAKQKEESAQNYLNAYSQQDRNALSKGMQRSSYNGATLGNIAIAGNKAQKDLNDELSRNSANIGSQRTQAASQLAETLKQYTASEQSDILSYMDTLTSEDYERSTAADQNYSNLLASIYEYASKAEDTAREQANWEKEFGAKYPNYGKTGSGSGSGNGKTKPSVNDVTIPDIDALKNAIYQKAVEKKSSDSILSGAWGSK